MKNQIKKWLPLLLAVMMTAALFTVPAGAVDVTVKSYPSVSHMKIDGTPVVGETLTFSYDLYDPEGTEGLDSKLIWHLQDAPYAAGTSSMPNDETDRKLQDGGTTLTIPESAAGKYIAITVKVSSISGSGRMRTVGVGPILEAKPTEPTASTVTIENASSAIGAVVGEPLVGHYLYAGVNAEGNSTYQWSLATAEKGPYTPVEGATGKTYTPAKEDAGKYLKFTVMPADSTGANGIAAESVTKPVVGSASYGAMVTGDGNTYARNMQNSITNGIEERDIGGRIYMYGSGNPRLIIDLGETRVLKGAAITFSLTFKDGDAEPTITMASSLTGAADSFAPIHMSGYTGAEADDEAFQFRQQPEFDFVKPIQTRFVYFTATKDRNFDLREVALLEALPTSLTAAAKEDTKLQVEEGATEAEVRAALAGNLTITAAYDGGVSYEIPLSKAAIELNTTGGGTKDMKVSYKGQEATVSVQVGSAAAVTSLTATKPANHTNALTVFTGATDDEVRSVIDGVYAIKATRSDSTEVTLKAKDVEIALDRAAAGTDKTCTLAYGGQTATIAGIKVADKKQPPNIYGLWLEGAPVVGETLTLHYTLDDPDNVAGGEAGVKNVLKWHRVTKYFGDTYANYDKLISAGGFALDNDGNLTYTVTAEDEGKYIDAAIGLQGGDVLPRGPWDRKSTVAIGPVLAAKSTTPAVSTVTISSMGLDGGQSVGANIGQTLRGEYAYVGAAAEGASTYQWYSSSSETDGFTAIAGATEREYTVRETDRGKYLKFTVTPKDTAGTAGTAADSINRPMAGNAAYLAMATEAAFNDTTNNARIGNNSQCLTNGISNGGNGGNMYVFKSTPAKIGMATIDLGKTQTLTGAQLTTSNEDAADTVTFYTSQDGLYWYPAETTDTAPILLSSFHTALGKKVTFKTPVQGRYLQIRYTRGAKDIRVCELQAFVQETAPALQSIAAAAKDSAVLTVKQGAAAADVQAYLAENVTVTATYAGVTVPVTLIAEAPVTYTLDTSAAGAAVNATVSFCGKTTTIPVKVEAPEVQSIAVTKAQDVGDIKVPLNTDAAALKNLLKDKVVIAATYAGGSTVAIPGEDAEYSAVTTAAGTVNVTVTYGGKTATISIIVEDKALTGITVTKAESVTGDINVWQNAADLKAALADKIVIKAQYSDGSEETVDTADAVYTGSTATTGKTNVTVSYGGKTATIEINVQAVTLTGITATKAPGVSDIKVPQNTNAAGLKQLLADKIVITGTYSDGSTKPIANENANYGGATSAVGTANITITYAGKTTTISVTVEAETPADVDPSLFGMRITGTPVVGETLTFEYDLYDPMNKESNIVSKIDWQQQDTAELPHATGHRDLTSLQTGSKTYTIPNDSKLIGKYISVNVQMVGINGNARCRTIGVGPIQAAAPEKPTAYSVNIMPAPGSAKAGCDTNQTLMGDYLYAGAQPEGASTYQWYSAVNPNGPFTAIEGATERTYTPTDADWHKYLQFHVTPVDNAGATGDEAESFNAPRVGNVAYRAHVSGITDANVDPQTGISYRGVSLDVITNGVSGVNGGSICTFGDRDNFPRMMFATIDLGAVRTLEGARVYGSGTNGKDGVALQISRTGEKGSFTLIHSAEFEGEGDEIITYKTYDDNDGVTFAEPVTGRYVRVGFTRDTNIGLREVELLAVQDKAPVITLTGGNELKLLRGETYVEPGFTATDEEDGDLTANVAVTGTVDTSTVGNYELTYSVTDSRPQTTIVVRRVLVADGYQEDGDLAYGQNVAADGENATNLTDGNKFTYWQAGSTTSSATIDLGSEQKVSNAVLIEDGNVVTGYVIEVSKDGSSWRTAYTGTTIGTRQSVDFDTVSGRYVRLRFTGASSAPKMATIEIRYDDLGKAKEAAAALILEGNLDALTEDLALPEKGLNGAVITWQSDNTAAISSRGIIHRSEAADQHAVLTATITVGKASVTKTFPVTVLKRTTSGGGGGFGGGGGGGRNDGSTIQIPTTQPDIPNNQPGGTTGKFKDVPDSHWAKNFIENLGSKGIVGGREDGTFDAEGALTRAEFLKMIVQVFDLQTDAPKAAFTDVAESDWYYTYVATASTLGVAQGMGDGSFGAEALITRQDMAVLIARAAAVAEKDLGEAGDLSHFTDAVQVSDYANAALSQLVGASIIGGDDTGALNPVNNATRAEAAKILYLVLNLVQA